MRASWAALVGGLVLAAGCSAAAPEPAPPSPAATPSGASSAVTPVPLTPSPRPTRPLPPDLRLRWAPVVSGLDRPTYVTSSPGDPRLFVLEQVGRIRVVRDGRLLAEPFLDLSDKVLAGGERGLLGLAFHPDYATNGRFFVHYTARPDGDTRVEQYRVSPVEPDRADRDSAVVVLEVDQPSPVHNGGMLTFGPDGMLYLGLGDGGPGNDPRRAGQDRSSLLGKILRLDVNDEAGGRGYATPPDNPFATGGGAAEVWAYGLRNPWRFSFDPVEGLLYVGDVGQYRHEEINVIPARMAGANFGWSVREGAHCFRSGPCDTAGLVEPTLEYPHTDKCAVIGGFVYDGRAIPAVRGHYFYADLCAGWLRSFRMRDGQPTEPHDWTDQVGRLPFPTSFGIDAQGELYATGGDGTVYQLVPAGS